VTTASILADCGRPDRPQPLAGPCQDDPKLARRAADRIIAGRAPLALLRRGWTALGRVAKRHSVLGHHPARCRPQLDGPHAAVAPDAGACAAPRPRAGALLVAAGVAIMATARAHGKFPDGDDRTESDRCSRARLVRGGGLIRSFTRHLAGRGLCRVSDGP
jgi:hypothetical protein